METTSLKEFLESHPPNSQVLIKDQVYKANVGHIISVPNLWLECSHNECQGPRWFIPGKDEMLSQASRFMLQYRCRNCHKSFKDYALAVTNDSGPYLVTKIGETPPFGPTTPPHLISLIGPDRESFLKGRRAENQGLGIGAFAYYRRVVENQKNRLLDEIIRVCEATGTAEAIVTELVRAKSETQFTRAVESVKLGIPEAMKISGQNPLLLLHRALSEGIHAKTDEECLELATAIRVVLTAMSDRLRELLKEQKELHGAVSKLLGGTKPAEKPTKSGST